MKVKDTKEALNKAVNKISEAGKTAGKVLSETGKQIKDSEFVEKAGEGIKTAVQGAASGAEKVSEEIKTKAKKTKAAIQEKQQAKEPEHTIVKIKNSDITFLIPDEYQKLKDPSFLNKALNAHHKYDCAYACGTPNSTNIIWVYAVDKKHPVLLDSAKDRINEIHEQLGDDQGVIEVKEGATAGGCNFIYSIVKTIGDGQTSPIGSRYFLRLLIGKGNDAIEINGSFEETGTTGMRDSMCSFFARNAGLCSLEDDTLQGWSCDPYDPEYKHGIPMNLSEKEGLDGLFPYHPLTKAREFLLAVLKNKFVIIKKDNKSEPNKDNNEGPDTRSDQEQLKGLFVDECRRHTYDINLEEDTNQAGKVVKTTLDDKLKSTIDDYNAAYALMSDKGTSLYIQRERSIDLIMNVENLINSIANSPKSFSTDMSEIVLARENFVNTCNYAKKELEIAQQSAKAAGAGVAGGMAVASLAPSTAMWVATTFGTASTGTAISALSGAAATNAALAWLGGGTVALGGGGMAAGNAFLALTGPIGWGIAGATLLTSIVLISTNKKKLNKQKEEEIKSILDNIEKVKEADAKIKNILDKTEALRENLNSIYAKCLSSYGKSFTEMPIENQTNLGTLVNETKALSTLLKEGI